MRLDDRVEQAWAEAKVALLATSKGTGWRDQHRAAAVGQQRLFDLQAQGDMLDENLYTAPGKYGGGGGGTTWLVGFGSKYQHYQRVNGGGASPERTRLHFGLNPCYGRRTTSFGTILLGRVAKLPGFRVFLARGTVSEQGRRFALTGDDSQPNRGD
jgi:hypothetical protein